MRRAPRNARAEATGKARARTPPPSSERAKVAFVSPQRHSSPAAFARPPSPLEVADDTLVRKLNFTTKTAPTPGRALRNKMGEPLQVYLRVRPSPESKDHAIVVESLTTVELLAPQTSQTARNGETSAKFTFSKVFPSTATQQLVYDTCALPLIHALLEGQNGLLFAYGITNSGKTHTVQGTQEDPGVLPRMARTLFDRLGAGDRDRFSVWVSYLEIYNERIFDLLADNNCAAAAPAAAAAAAAAAASEERDAADSLKLQSDSTGNVFVTGLREVEVTTVDEAMAIVAQAQRRRQVADTLTNARSSRSHAVFTVKLVKVSSDKDSDGIWSKLSVVDLAGSERTHRTQNKGQRLKEASKINNSLVTLGRCLEALRINQQRTDGKQMRVPYRESQITRLFKDALSGCGRTVMIATANPHPADYDETVHALKYAALAREIRTAHRIDNRNPYESLPLPLRQNSLKRGAEKTSEQLHTESSSSSDASDNEAEPAAAARAVRPRGRGAAADVGAAARRAGARGAAESGVQRLLRSSAAKHRREPSVLEEPKLSPPRASGAEPDADEEDATEALLDELYELKQQLVCMEERCSANEAAVRSELAAEMARQAAEMEAAFAKRLAAERARAQDTLERRLLLAQQNSLAANSDAGDAALHMLTTEQASQHARALERMQRAHEEAMADVRASLEQHRERADVAERALAAAREELENERAAAEEQAAAAEASVTAVRAAAQQQLQAQLRSFEALTQRMASAGGAFDSLRESVTTANAQRDAAEGARAEAVARVADAEKKLKTASAKAAKLSEQLLGEQQQKQQLQADLTAAQQAKEKALRSNAEARSHTAQERESLRARVQELEDQLAARTAAEASATEKADRAESRTKRQAAQLEKALAEANSQLVAARAEVAAERSRFEQQVVEVTTAREQHAALLSKVDEQAAALKQQAAAQASLQTAMTQIKAQQAQYAAGDTAAAAQLRKEQDAKEELLRRLRALEQRCAAAEQAASASAADAERARCEAQAVGMAARSNVRAEEQQLEVAMGETVADDDPAVDAVSTNAAPEAAAAPGKQRRQRLRQEPAAVDQDAGAASAAAESKPKRGRSAAEKKLTSMVQRRTQAPRTEPAEAAAAAVDEASARLSPDKRPAPARVDSSPAVVERPQQKARAAWAELDAPLVEDVEPLRPKPTPEQLQKTKEFARALQTQRQQERRVESPAPRATAKNGSDAAPADDDASKAPLAMRAYGGRARKGARGPAHAPKNAVAQPVRLAKEQQWMALLSPGHARGDDPFASSPEQVEKENLLSVAAAESEQPVRGGRRARR